MFLAAALLAAHGIHLLRSVGRSRRRIMEDTQEVVAAGVYRYIRHPLSGSLVLLVWGVYFKGTDLVSGILAVVATGCWVTTARFEERFNIERFGSRYVEYMRRTKMFVPFVF